MHPGRTRDIVKDKMATILRADEIAAKLADIIKKEADDFDCDDDPAEFIYLTIHTMGNLLAKICVSLEGYGHTYGIPSLTIKAIQEWVKVIMKDNIALKTKPTKRS
jgi:hypothetical protein